MIIISHLRSVGQFYFLAVETSYFSRDSKFEKVFNIANLNITNILLYSKYFGVWVVHFVTRVLRKKKFTVFCFFYTL